MDSEQKNTISPAEPPDEAWDVFLLDDEEPWPELGDFWRDLADCEEDL